MKLFLNTQRNQLINSLIKSVTYTQRVLFLFLGPAAFFVLFLECMHFDFIFIFFGFAAGEKIFLMFHSAFRNKINFVVEKKHTFFQKQN